MTKYIPFYYDERKFIQNDKSFKKIFDDTDEIRGVPTRLQPRLRPRGEG